MNQAHIGTASSHYFDPSFVNGKCHIRNIKSKVVSWWNDERHWVVIPIVFLIHLISSWKPPKRAKIYKANV